MIRMPASSSCGLAAIVITLAAAGCTMTSVRDPAGGTTATAGGPTAPRRVVAYPRRAAVATQIETLVPLADASCGADEDCTIVAAGRSAWCNFEHGVIVAVSARAERKIQSRLDALALGSTVLGEDMMICATALARCDRGVCDLEWDWAQCTRDADCVRIELGSAGEEALVNACNARSARRLARQLLAERPDASREDVVRVLESGVSCVERRCRARP